MKPMTEQKIPRGKLKLFLGYADGVGKTFTMLQAARQRLEEGLRVAIAWIDPADQEGSGGLLEGMEIIPHHAIPPRDDVRDAAGPAEEMNTDLILASRPGLALVDDLAAVNPPGSRHPRRFQDMEELLDGGINVYATLNVQNLESLRDIVLQITGVRVQETIPDSIFDQANIIELVDLAPDELLQRYQEGKIHLSPSQAPAARLFYRLGNLTALRELSMRRAAGRVEDQMQAYMTDRAISGPWPTSERVLVCVSAHPVSQRLVRAGHRLATALNASWFALYVETPERLQNAEKHQEQVLETLRLAEELGARVVKVSGRTIPEAVINFARAQNITKIIVGKPLRPRWQEIFTGSVNDEILRRSQGAFDVHVISDERAPLNRTLPEALHLRGRWERYLVAPLTVAGATLLGLPLINLIHPVNLVMLFLVAVVITAAYAGRGPSMLASFLSVLAYDYFFIHPQFSLGVSDTQYVLTFFGLLIVGLVIGNLSGLVRDQVITLQYREEQTTTLYNLSRELTVLVDPTAILKTVIQHIAQTFSRESAILLPGEGKILGRDQLEIRAASAGLALTPEDIEAAAWAFEHGQPSGRGTSAFPTVGLRCQPLRTPRGIIGILGFKPADERNYLTTEQRQFLDAYASLAALAIERSYLAEEASRSQINSATEKLQSALLNSISHDLRTPLATITGVFSSLSEAEQSGDGALELAKADRIDLIDTGWEEARRLNRLVGNLLDITRLEAGALKLRLISSDIQDVVGAALRRLAGRLGDHPVLTNIPPNLPPVPMDFVLIEQVLVNLLDNAVKYSPPGSPIEISASQQGQTLAVAVSDHGDGIPPADLEKIFGKFYRAQQRGQAIVPGGFGPGANGTGLGLSICKGIIEAHGGTITAENCLGRGALFRFSLPLETHGSIPEGEDQ